MKSNTQCLYSERYKKQFTEFLMDHQKLFLVHVVSNEKFLFLFLFLKAELEKEREHSIECWNFGWLYSTPCWKYLSHLIIGILSAVSSATMPIAGYIRSLKMLSFKYKIVLWGNFYKELTDFKCYRRVCFLFPFAAMLLCFWWTV